MIGEFCIVCNPSPATPDDQLDPLCDKHEHIDVDMGSHVRRVSRFEWNDALPTANALRSWLAETFRELMTTTEKPWT